MQRLRLRRIVALLGCSCFVYLVRQTITEASDIHVALTCDESYVVGLLAVINSTLSNTVTPERIQFHLISPDAVTSERIRQLVGSVFQSARHQPRLETYVLDLSKHQDASDFHVYAQYRAEAVRD